MATLRRKSKTRSAALLLICCEGARTEIQYLEEWQSKYPRVHISVISPPDNQSAPTGLVNAIKAKMRVLRFETGDQAWIVRDEDRWSGNQLALLHQEAKRAKLLEARSNPNFHIWLLAHFEPIGVEISKEEIDDRLRHHMNGFDKCNLQMSKLRPNRDTAIKNAEAADVTQQVSVGNSRVYLLMRAILELTA